MCVYLHCFCAVCQVTCLLSRIIADLDKLLRNHDIQCKLSYWYLVHGTPCSRSTSLEFDKRLNNAEEEFKFHRSRWLMSTIKWWLFIYLFTCLFKILILEIVMDLMPDGMVLLAKYRLLTLYFHLYMYQNMKSHDFEILSILAHGMKAIEWFLLTLLINF